MQLDPIKDSQQVTDFNIRIKKKLEKVDKDTQKKKTKKFHRDLGDFQSTSVYLWQQVKGHLPNDRNVENVQNEGSTGRSQLLTTNAPPIRDYLRVDGPIHPPSDQSTLVRN